MSIKSDDLKTLADRAGIAPEDLQAAFASEDEVTLEIKPFEFFDESQLSALKTNVGKAAIEVEIKNFKREKNIDFTGKTLQGIYDYANSIGMKEGHKEPEQKYKELEDKYKLKIGELENMNSTIDQYKGKLFDLSASTKLKGAVDFDTTIPQEDLIVLFKAKHQLKQGEDGETYVQKLGAADLIKEDKTQSPIKAEDVYKKFAESYLKTGKGLPPKMKGTVDGDLTFETKREFDEWAATETDQSLINKVHANSANKYKASFFK